jgi:DNA-binding GntR family transcriptional regulator
MNRTKPRNTAAEHKRLMEAAIGRQSELATALLKEHIQLTAQNVMEIELPTAKR